MLAPIPSPTRSYYHRTLGDRLRLAAEYIHTHPPAEIRPRFKHMVVLLEQAWLHEHLHPLAIDLTAALYPWPKRWGFIWDWVAILTQAIEVSKSLGRAECETLFATHLGELLLAIGNPQGALEMGERALQLAQQQKKALAVAQSGWVMCEALSSCNRTAESDALLDTLAQTLPSIPSPTNQITVQLLITSLHSRRARRLGELHPALALWQPLWDKVETTANIPTDILAHARITYAFLLFQLNQIDEMIQHLECATAILDHAGDEIGANGARGELAYAYMLAGKHTTAQILLLQAMKQAEHHRLQQDLATYSYYLGSCYLCSGELTQALSYIERALALHHQFGHERLAWLARINRGGIHSMLGNVEAATADIHACHAHYEASQHTLMFIFCLFNLAFIDWIHEAWAEGQAKAEKAYTMSITQLPEQRHLVLFSQRCLALFAPPEEATTLLQNALTLSKELKLLVQEAACLLSLAGLATDRKEQDSLWAEGVRILRQIEATAWVNGRSPTNPPFIAMLY